MFVSVPAIPALQGLVLRNQFGVIGPMANPGGLIVSNSGRVKIQP